MLCVRRGHVPEFYRKILKNFDYVKLWGRNAKVFVSTEILFAIFVSWVELYKAIFMRSLGFNEIFIGFVLMLPLIPQTFLPILGGYLADRFGRKRVLMFFDSVGWIGSTAAWALAQEPIHVIVAALLQGLSTTIYGVWETLLVEDTQPHYRASIYSTIQTIYVFSGILTPGAGALVSLYGVELGSRYIFLAYLLALIGMFATRQALLTESKIGILLSSKGTEKASMHGVSYVEVLKAITKHKKLLIVFALTTIGAIQYQMATIFKPLYLSDPRALALDESIISVVPMASSIPSLLALFFIIPRLNLERIRKALLFCYACGILGLVVLIIAPKGSLTLAILSAILDSARYIAVFCILRTLLVNTIDEANELLRAKVMSLIIAFPALVSWPMPMVGGYLYTSSPALPFIVTMLLLILSMYLVAFI